MFFLCSLDWDNILGKVYKETFVSSYTQDKSLAAYCDYTWNCITIEYIVASQDQDEINKLLHNVKTIFGLNVLINYHTKF